MKRLTFEGNFCDIAMCDEVRGGSFCEDGDCSQRKIWERLKAIENILGDEYDLGRLWKLAQADREGRCVMLPVKPGAPVWSIAFCKVDDDGTEHPTGPWPFSLLMLDAWGEEWFLTREEAEKALEEIKNG